MLPFQRRYAHRLEENFGTVQSGIEIPKDRVYKRAESIIPMLVKGESSHG